MVLGSTCEDKIATQPYQDFKKNVLKIFLYEAPIITSRNRNKEQYYGIIRSQ